MISDLRNKIYIVRKTWIDDGFGGQVKDGLVSHTAFAKIESDSGNETVNYDAVTHNKRFVFVIRKQDVKTSDVIVYDGAEYNILDIQKMNDRDFYIRITAQKSEITGG